MSSKKVLTAINIICFIIFVLIQSLIFFLKILDYSLDGSRNGIDDVIFYIFDTANTYFIQQQNEFKQKNN